MKSIIPLITVVVILISCGAVDPISVIDGNYEGTYSITHNYGTDSAYTKQGKISFEFSKGRYSYIGEYYSENGWNYYLLPESSGIFQFNRRKVKLVDNGRHNGYVDWTLFLNGDFDYLFDGKKLSMTQVDEGNNYHHKLMLVKQ